MAFLFDTDALSEVLRRRPLAGYLSWLMSVPRDEQFTSSVVIGELYSGAFRSTHAERHLENIETRVLPAISVLPYELGTARVHGQIRAHLQAAGTMPADADLQIAATALQHELELVTGNVKRFRRVPGLKINSVLADARRAV